MKVNALKFGWLIGAALTVVGCGINQDNQQSSTPAQINSSQTDHHNNSHTHTHRHDDNQSGMGSYHGNMSGKHSHSHGTHTHSSPRTEQS